MKVLKSDFVLGICESYPNSDRPTIRGLAQRLETNVTTLNRIKSEQYRPGSSYRVDKASYNRKIGTSDFRTVQKAMERIRERTYGKQGGYFSPV